MKTEFNVSIASDGDHEKVFAEIYCGEKFVALVTQDEGLNHLMIEFPEIEMNESVILRNVNLEGFQNALVLATKKLAGATDGAGR